MRTMAAKDAKNTFGLLVDYARAEPVTVEKHGRAVSRMSSFSLTISSRFWPASAVSSQRKRVSSDCAALHCYAL